MDKAEEDKPTEVRIEELNMVERALMVGKLNGALRRIDEPENRTIALYTALKIIDHVTNVMYEYETQGDEVDVDIANMITNSCKRIEDEIASLLGINGR